MIVSVAIATYNGKNYLSEQLNSILLQTILPDEIVVADDCSSDGTEKLIKKFIEKTHIPIVYLKGEKQEGYTANFNRALLKTKGDLVFLCDQDDVWFNNKIEEVIKCAINSKKMLIIHDKIYTDEKLNSYPKSAFQNFEEKGNKLNEFVSGSVMAVKRELLNICLPIPVSFTGHDNWISYHAQAINTVQVLNMPLMYYRRHADATMEKNKNINKYNFIEKVNAHLYYLNSLYLNNITLLRKLKEMEDDVMYGDIKYFMIKFRENNLYLELRNKMKNMSRYKRIKLAIDLYGKSIYRGFSGKITFLVDFLS
mgnify:CR=1 FL=1|jgi:glycosyltransferase involved in cell wall biosynthesis